MSSAGAAPRAAVPVSSARAEASRKNGAKSRGPNTPEGKTRSAQNALKHGLRAQKYVVLPEEDAAEFAVLEAAMIEELAPVGTLQTVLARRVAVAAWRLARADRIEADLFAERSWGADANPGLALIRDGNGTRSFETLLRYRGAAMAEFWRALKTLKALQAEQAAAEPEAVPVRARPARPAGHPQVARHAQPNEPERGAGRLVAYAPPATPEPGHTLHATAANARQLNEPKRATDLRLDYILPELSAPGRALHEPAAPWTPNEPEAGRDRQQSPGLTRRARASG